VVAVFLATVALAGAASARPSGDPNALVITPTRGFRAGTGTCSIDPRPPHARGSRTSGDLRIVTMPEDVEVHYYYKGGSSFPGVLKGIRARRTLIVVAAPSVRARFRAFVPVRSGHITTVKLRLPPPERSKE
jgi:hypothetical protein